MSQSYQHLADKFCQLLTIMDELREKCPWDRQQSIGSLRHLTIEETYELSAAIMENDWREIKNELGDLLLHIVFYAKIASENQTFDIGTVIDGICEKLIRRHPHVFATTEAVDEAAVKTNWEKLKLAEKENKGVLSGVPSSLPTLIKAHRLQEKVSHLGFDWDESKAAWAKVEEEMQELQANVVENKDHSLIVEEFGDLLFSLVNYSRFLAVNPDSALEKTNQKFIRRFEYLEQAVKQAGKDLREMSLAEMDVYWQQAKQLEKR